MTKDNKWQKAPQTFTDYLEDQFIKTGECIKDNFEDLYPAWKEELDDEELDKFAIEWANERIKIEIKKIDK